MSGSYELIKNARTVKEAVQIMKESAWSDVAAKAKRLKDGGRVLLTTNEIHLVEGQVDGDHGTYDIKIERQDLNNINRRTGWQCSCPWGYWAKLERTRSFKPLFDRPCSHIVAATWQSWSQPLTSDPQQTLWKRKMQEQMPPQPLINREVIPQELENIPQEQVEQPVQMTLPGMENYNVPAPGIRTTKWKKI